MAFSRDFLIVNYAQHEMSLRMVTNRAFCRSFFTDNNLAAVGADPYLLFLAFENTVVFNVGEQGTVSFLMLLFNLAYFLKEFGNFGKAFLFGSLSHIGIHFGPFEVLTCRSVLQVRNGVMNIAAMQCLEPHLGMLFFIACSLLENGCYLVIAFLLGLAGIKSVFVPCSGFAGKCGFEIFSVLLPFNLIIYSSSFIIKHRITFACRYCYRHMRHPQFFPFFQQFLRSPGTSR